jgi:transcriptional regulator EpsA
MAVARRLGDQEDRDRLVYILETALDVRRSSHFFAWTQGPVQSLLPHEIIICGLADLSNRDLRMRYYTATRYFREEHFDAACNPRSGLITKAIRHWRGLRAPQLVPTSLEHTPVDPTWEEPLRRLELRNMAAHGQLSPCGEVQAWFGFFRVPELGAHTATALELLIPCISATYARVLVHEMGGGPTSQLVANLLSSREIQVLQLVRDGHSNAEIAQRLDLSVMTAKNHVQNIRRKLKVKTRGQAVADALRLGLIQPQSQLEDA